jgi:hypothetical protein
VLKPVKTYKSLDILNQTSEKFYWLHLGETWHEQQSRNHKNHKPMVARGHCKYDPRLSTWINE